MSDWMLDPNITFLNHGSFGSCPRPVLEYQQSMRELLERQPVQFMVKTLEPMLDEARAALASFVGANPDNLTFVPNATTGVNAVLRSQRWEAGDEILITNHEYNACRNVVNFLAETFGVKINVVHIPFPIKAQEDIAQTVLEAVTPRTKLVLLDHLTSQTGIIFPIADIARHLRERGVELLVDGAHAPGSIPLSLETLGATYYTGNCHKWICAPKGAAMLWVHPDKQKKIRPTVISHGANSLRTDKSRFQIEFWWTGTWDPSAYLSVPEALKFMASQHPEGWDGIMKRNRELALEARTLLCDTLKVPVPAPAAMLAGLASIPLPNYADKAQWSPLYGDSYQGELLEKHRIEVPIMPWDGEYSRLIRISAQLYNNMDQFRFLARVLAETGPWRRQN